jgi:hypothetical protein
MAPPIAAPVNWSRAGAPNRREFGLHHGDRGDRGPESLLKAQRLGRDISQKRRRRRHSGVPQPVPKPLAQGFAFDRQS